MERRHAAWCVFHPASHPVSYDMKIMKGEAHEEGRGRAALSSALIVGTIGPPGPGPFMDFTLFTPFMS